MYIIQGLSQFCFSNSKVFISQKKLYHTNEVLQKNFTFEYLLILKNQLL